MRRFLDHPVHSLIVHLPISFWIASLVCDILYMVDGNSAFAAVSYYCILFGLMSVLMAAPTGVAEYMEIPGGGLPKRIASIHLSLNLFATILFILNFFSRHGLEDDLPSSVTRTEMLLSVISVALLAISGYLGGILVYQYGIGLRPVTSPRPGRSDMRRAA